MNVPVYLRLTVNGRRSQRSISVKVDPEKWNSKTGKMRGWSPEATQVNQYLYTVRSKINRIHHRFVDEEKPVTTGDLKSVYMNKGEKLKMLLNLFEEHNRQMEKLIGGEFARGTFKRYTTTKNRL